MSDGPKKYKKKNLKFVCTSLCPLLPWIPSWVRRQNMYYILAGTVSQWDQNYINGLIS